MQELEKTPSTMMLINSLLLKTIIFVGLTFDCLKFSVQNQVEYLALWCALGVANQRANALTPPASSTATWVNSLRGSDLTWPPPSCHLTSACAHHKVHPPLARKHA